MAADRQPHRPAAFFGPPRAHRLLRPLAMVSLDDQVAAIAKGLRLQQGARKTLDIFGDLAVTGKF